MDEDRDDSSMKITQVCLPDSYSAAGNNLFDEIQRLSRDIASIESTQLPLTTTRSSESGLRRKENCHEQIEIPNVRLHPTSTPDNLLGPVDGILFDDFGEVAESISSQANPGEFEENYDVPQEWTQSYEHLKNADLFSNKIIKPNSSSGSSTGTVIRGDDARNAVLQAKEYHGLFDAAERSTPQSIDPDYINWTTSLHSLPQDWTIPRIFPAKAPAADVPSFGYQSSPAHRQWSPRSVHAAKLDPMYLRAPNPTLGPRQYTSFDNGNIGASSTVPANATSMDCAASSRNSCHLKHHHL